MIAHRPKFLGILFGAALTAFFAVQTYAQSTGSAPVITSGPTVAAIEATSAVIVWRTDIESTTVVSFGTTETLDQEYNKIIPIEDTEVTEVSHSMTLSELIPDTIYYFRAKSMANGATVVSPVRQFRTSSSCTADEWSCPEWGACSPDGKQSRVCVLKTDCRNVETPRPAESQECKPPEPVCSSDEWSCDAWGACSAEGRQTRACTLKTDCSTANTPKPAISQSCTPPVVPKPVPPQEVKAEEVELPPVEKTVPAPPAAQPPTQPPTPDAVVPEPEEKVVAGDVGGTVTVMANKIDLHPMMKGSFSGECAAAGIPPEDCAAWLAVKYSERSCKMQGFVMRDSCEAYLTGQNGGVFPGCEGASADQCQAAKDRTLFGLLSEEEKADLDAAMTEGKMGEVMDELGDDAPLVLAVSKTMRDQASWYPSIDGKETAPGIIIMDTDKDGIPDDVERRLGMDPIVPEVQVDGAASAKVTRAILKAFFAAHDKPSSPQFLLLDTDGDSVPDMLIDDRKFLGLKTYDPSKAYLIGDTVDYNDELLAKVSRPVLKGYFETGVKPTQSPFVSIDTNGDGIPNARVSRSVLKQYFGADKPTQGVRGDVPKQADFDSPIDSVLGIDRAILEGNPLEQPIGAGELDSTFSLELVTDQNGSEDAGARRNQEQDTMDIAKKTTGAAASNVLRGRSTPNAVITLFIYSYVPMVLTTTADANGDFTYDIADNVVDGEHTAYIAVTDNDGKITKKSNPLAFFVKDAVAATTDAEFLRSDTNVPTGKSAATASYMLYYVLGAAVLVIVALGLAWRFTRGSGKPKASPSALTSKPTPPQTPPPPATKPPTSVPPPSAS